MALKYKVIIPTSGTGSRLGDLTEYTNKSLVKLGDKPAICHIINNYDKDIELVILLGHFGNHVKQLLEMVYPDRNITFVEVDNYCGKGSSLVYSLLQAESVIDCPFIIHACDTIVKEDIPKPSCNWLGGKIVNSSSQYTSFNVIGDKVKNINEKGQLNYDMAFIGIAGIKDWKIFFNTANIMYKKDNFNSQLSNIHIHSEQIKNGLTFNYHQFSSWLDIGNIDTLKETKEYFTSQLKCLDKSSEAIYLIDNKVIKFFANSEISKKRVIRANMLEGLVPQIEKSTDNFYSYNYVKGETLSRIINPAIFYDLLNWAKDKLWSRLGNIKNYREVCRNFYYFKTLKRIEKFCNKFNIKDELCIINGNEVPSAIEMINSISGKLLYECKFSLFHGDFILDNIIYTPDKEFVLTDWRQDFGNIYTHGDMYYDLAKLNCSLTFNQDIINQNLFSVSAKNKLIDIDIMTSENLSECKRVFRKNFCYEITKIEILSAIVWLNMAALHEYPLSLFLYYFGRLKLYYAMRLL